MNNNLLMMIVVVLSLLLAWKIWAWNFQSRKSRTKKQHAKTVEGIKTRIGVDKYKAHNDRMVEISAALDKLPIGKLTDEKRSNLTDLIASANYLYNGKLRIPEDVHVQQWIFVAVFLVGVALVSRINSILAVAYVLAPYIFTLPVSNLKESRQSEVNAAMVDFRRFYNLYYAQYRRLGSNLRLQEVIESFKNMANTAMIILLERVESDIGRGEVFALEQLDARYPDNAKIHKFCILAEMVSRGEGTAATALKAFKDQLEAEKRLRREKALEKRQEKGSMACKIFIRLLLGVSIAVYLTTIVKGVRG